MKSSRMLQDILNQSASLAKVLGHQSGEGAAALSGAAAVLRQAPRVVFTGMGSSLFATIAAVRYLAHHGFAAEAIDTSELLYSYARALAPETAVILVSRSGETVEVTRLLPLLSAAGVRTIAVTNEPGSRLARRAAKTILVHSDSDKMVAVQTYTGTLTTLLLLSAAVTETPIAAGFLPGAVSAAIEDSLTRADGWTEFLAGAPVVYLLGRGASLASAHEGALLFHEAARMPAIAMSAAQFRHGPVEAIDERFRAIVFASEEATRELDSALARDIEGMGGRVRVCGAGDAPFPFAPVVEIVPVEVAVCAMAESKGFEPGQFRFATQVTSTETGFGGPHST